MLPKSKVHSLSGHTPPAPHPSAYTSGIIVSAAVAATVNPMPTLPESPCGPPTSLPSNDASASATASALPLTRNPALAKRKSASIPIYGATVAERLSPLAISISISNSGSPPSESVSSLQGLSVALPDTRSGFISIDAPKPTPRTALSGPTIGIPQPYGGHWDRYKSLILLYFSISMRFPSACAATM